MVFKWFSLIFMSGLSSIRCLQSTAHCTYNDCEDYCAGTCPFRNNMSSPGSQNLTVYRMTPWNVTDLADHDTGDAAGDLGFLLLKYLSSSECKPPLITRSCFLDDRTLLGKFEVEFDAQFGPYLKCNPNYIEGTDWLNMSDWLCGYGYPGPDLWSPSAGECPNCDRANVSVGADPAMHRWNDKRSLASYFGGIWYSTPSRGQCTDGHVPNDGSGCTWRLLEAASFVNASCVAHRLFAIVKKAQPSCFVNCGPDDKPGTHCFIKCVEDTVLGNSTRPGIDPKPMVDALIEAFDATDGCPVVKVSNTTR